MSRTNTCLLSLLACVWVALVAGCPHFDRQADSIAVAAPRAAEPGPIVLAVEDYPTPGNPKVYAAGVVAGSCQLYGLGPGMRGDFWEIDAVGISASPAVVVLFDADYTLLARELVHHAGSLAYVVRRPTDQIVMGVMPFAFDSHTSYRLTAIVVPGHPIPSPRRQVVYIDFGDGCGVPPSEPFDGATLGSRYAGETATLKWIITSRVRRAFEPYDVAVYDSETGGPPERPYSTLCYHSEPMPLLGRAPCVDVDNNDPNDLALVYVDSFAIFGEAMDMSPEQVGAALANTGIHEVGHLLGLWHTTETGSVMSNSHSMWDMISDLSFARSRLAATVFQTGWQDAPRTLRDTVGSRP